MRLKQSSGDSRSERNLRILTDGARPYPSPTRKVSPSPPANMGSPVDYSSSLVPSLRPPMMILDELSSSSSLVQDSVQSDDDDIIFLGEMGDHSKAESRSSSSGRRDDLRSRDKGHSTGPRDRRGGNTDRHNSSIDNRRGSSRTRGQPSSSGQKRDRNGNFSSHHSNAQPMNSGFISLHASPMGGRPSMPVHVGAFTQEIPKKKFTTRCRLFVGNLPNEIKEDEFRDLFKEFGEISEVFLSGKGFGFLRLDTRAHAEAAKEKLDGKTVMGRQLRVRFAVHGATIKVKELSPVVSNEMLYHTFSIFGEVERAVHIVDEKGKPTGEAIVEFEKKASAQDALRSIEERVFVMTAHSHPIQAELLEPKDEEDGLSERMVQKTPQSIKEREVPPHFAEEKSFEYSYGKRWKELYKHEKAQREQLEQELLCKRRQLEADMQIAFEDYQAEKIREELEQRKHELERLEESRRNRISQMPPPDFSVPWGGSLMGPRGFDDVPLNFSHPPPGPSVFDGPHGRPATYGREPRFPEMRNHQHPPIKEEPFGLEINSILQAFRNPDDVHHGVRQSMNKSLGFPGDGPYHGGPLPFNAPPLMSTNSPRGLGPMHPPLGKRSRR